MQWRGAVYPVGVAMAILAATLSGSWWTAESFLVTVRVGLREVGVCAAGVCEWESLTGLPGAGAFKTIALLTYIAGWIASLSLIVGAGLRVFQGSVPSGITRLQVPACIAFGVLSILVVITFPGMSEVSISWPVVVAFFGSLAGIGAASGIGASRGWEGRGTYVPVKVNDPDVIGPAPNESRHQKATPATAATSAKPATTLRFVAESGEIGPDEISVVGMDGQRRNVRWQQICQIVARRLPAGMPLDNATFVDLVPATTGAEAPTPIRLLPQSQINFESLPEGRGSTPRESFRRLASFVCERNPNIEIESKSKVFFEERREAERFLAPKLFVQYDEAYAPLEGAGEPESR